MLAAAEREESLVERLVREVGPEKVFDALDEEERLELQYCWRAWARPKQIEPPGDWDTWLTLAGRGFGKTKTGAEFVREKVEQKKARRIALLGATGPDVRKIMVEGDSGILACSHPRFRPVWSPATRTITWPNGAQAFTYSAEEPDRLRGPQHDLAWVDEFTSFRYPEAHEMLEFGLRLGRNPRALITTTPRPTKALKELIADPKTVVVRGSTFENKGNLAPKFITRMLAKYKGTRLGRQELYAEILEDVVGALWTLARIEDARAPMARDAEGQPLGYAIVPDFARTVVGVDPAATSGADSDETGIVVAGRGVDGDGYVLGDYSCRLSPEGWARRAVQAYREHLADAIVAEVNNGGDMVEAVIHSIDPTVKVVKVHASRGKAVRAEPIASFYEQGRIHHVGTFPELEQQMLEWTPLGYDGSPDRMDALVWALTELLLGKGDVYFY